MSAGSGAGAGEPEVDEQPEDDEGSPAASGSESGQAGPDPGARKAEAPAAADDTEPDDVEPDDPEPVAAKADDAEPVAATADDRERGEPEAGANTPEPDAPDGPATPEDDSAAATAVTQPEGAAEPAAMTAIDADPPAPTPGPHFVRPRHDPSSVPPAEPIEPVDVTPAPVAQSPAVPPAVPQQYVTGGVPIVEIQGGWDAVYRRRHRQTLTFIAGFLLVLVLGCLAWLTYAGVVPWPFGGSVTVAQNVCTHSRPLAPKKISMRVFNGSGRDGLARQVAAQLRGLGFGVKVTGNDPLESRIKTQVEVRHGESGDLAAATMSAYVVGKSKDVQDDRQDSSIDLVLGPSFTRLHSKSELKKSLAAVTATLPMTCPPGVTPPPTGTPRPTTSHAPKARVTPRPTATPKR